ncbi:gas vesicle protein [Nonomuraea lactucae]|uniref:gas vesicle protein n=1 Tax=Nonomuraea lactucae TaxID=2249762 RepID=UPI000DE205BD|nr:gas vesicle protein [Nonomuraea lactucae]
MTFEETRGAVLAAEGRLPSERVALVDLLDRLLAGGVVLSGDLVLSIADIDLVRISIRALITSIRESSTPDDYDGPDAYDMPGEGGRPDEHG